MDLADLSLLTKAKWMMRSVLLAPLLVALFVLGIGFTMAQQVASAPKYIGSRACADCHQGQSDKWVKSHHSLAWQLPSSSTVLGDFNNTSIEHDGIRTSFTVPEESASKVYSGQAQGRLMIRFTRPRMSR